jgi:hypothetical protein
MKIISHFNVCIYASLFSHFSNVLLYDKRNVKKVKAKTFKKCPPIHNKRSITGKKARKMGILIFSVLKI